MPRGVTRASAEQWRERVRRWKESGLSSAEFAKQEGIERPQALSYWAYQLKRNDRGDAARTAPVLRVVKIEPCAVSEASDGVELSLPSGVRLMVHAGTNEQALTLALRALGVRA